MGWTRRSPVAATVEETLEPGPRVSGAGLAPKGSPRHVLYEAEQLRYRAKRAAEWVNLSRPGVRLQPAVTVGNFRIDDDETLAVVKDALTAAAERWVLEAAELEATVVVTP